MDHGAPGTDTPRYTFRPEDAGDGFRAEAASDGSADWTDKMTARRTAAAPTEDRHRVAPDRSRYEDARIKPLPRPPPAPAILPAGVNLGRHHAGEEDGAQQVVPPRKIGRRTVETHAAPLEEVGAVGDVEREIHVLLHDYHCDTFVAKCGQRLEQLGDDRGR